MSGGICDPGFDRVRCTFVENFDSHGEIGESVAVCIDGIGDFVWYDLDGNAVQDGGPEGGIGAVTLNLYRDVDGDGLLDRGDTLVASQNTNGRGVYEFLGLLANEYIVDVVNGTVPPGYGLTTANDPKAITLGGGHDEPVAVAVPERHGQDGRALLDPDRGQRRP